MMPHPERACEALLGGVDGRAIFESIVGAFRPAASLALQPTVVAAAAGSSSGSLSGERR